MNPLFLDLGRLGATAIVHPCPSDQRSRSAPRFRKWLVQYLDGRDVVPLDRLQEVADRIVELAKANHAKLVR